MFPQEGRFRPVVRLDHLVLGVPELDGAVTRIREEWGCDVRPGGRHPRWGSWNAIVPLEGDAYLEIVAPHPDPPEGGARVFGLDVISRPGLLTWAVRPEGRVENRAGLEALARRMRDAGVDPGPVLPGERRTPSGDLLTWALTDPFAHRMGGTVPFLIDWGATPHPSGTGAAECGLSALELGHPDARRLGGVLSALGAGHLCRVTPAPRPTLRARMRVPAGQVVLEGPA